MKDYRDQLAAHHDLEARPTHSSTFDAALEAAFYYYGIFLLPTWKADHPKDNRYPDDLKAYAADYR
jgi:hypothetical protein